MNSSITTEAPAAPKRLPESMSRTASIAWSIVSAMITPLPAASPSALITIGRGCARTYASAGPTSVKRS